MWVCSCPSLEGPTPPACACSSTPRSARILAPSTISTASRTSRTRSSISTVSRVTLVAGRTCADWGTAKGGWGAQTASTRCCTSRTQSIFSSCIRVYRGVRCRVIGLAVRSYRSWSTTRRTATVRAFVAASLLHIAFICCVPASRLLSHTRTEIALCIWVSISATTSTIASERSGLQRIRRRSHGLLTSSV